MKKRGECSLSSPSSAASSFSFFLSFFFFILFALASGDQRPGKCLLEVDEGTCSSQVLRWFFNRKTQHCETFVYSGCGGNDNNFNSTMYCLHACNGTASNTHSYSPIASSSSSSSSNSNSGKESSSPGRKLVKRSRGSKLRYKRSDDVTIRVPKQQRASPGDEGESLSSALTQLTQSVSRLESMVRHNSRRISKLGPKKAKRRFTLSPSDPKDHHHHHHHQDTVQSPDTSIGSEMRKMKQAAAERSDRQTDGSVAKRTPDSVEGEGDEDEKQRDLLDSKLRGVISDPSYVFSCRNISSLDLSTLKEAVLEFDTEAMREATSVASGDTQSNEEREKSLQQTYSASDSNSVQVNSGEEKQPSE